MARRLEIIIEGVTEGFSSAIGHADKDAESFGSRLGTIAKGALLAGGAFAAFEGVKETLTETFEAGERLTKSQEALDAAIEHTGGNVEALRDKYQAVAKGAANLGITEDEANRGLATATTLTGSAEKGMRAYQEAVELSAATHRSLSSILIATSKAQDGQTSSLTRYGVILDKNATGTEQFSAIMQRFGGQAEANTSQVDILKAKLADWREELGTRLVPVVDNAIQFVMNHWPEIQTTISNVWTQIKPIFVNLISIIVAVVDAIRTHWALIQTLIAPAVDAIKSAVKIITDALKLVTDLLSGNWSKAWKDAKALVGDVLAAIVKQITDRVAIIETAARLLGQGVLKGIKAGVSLVEGAVHSAISGAINSIDNLADVAFNHAKTIGTQVYKGVISAVKSLASDLWSAVKGAVNDVIGNLRGVGFDFSVPSIHIGPIHFGGGSIGFHPFSGIPYLAEGGIITSPTLAVVGERGPEAVVPLNRAMGQTVNITINGDVTGDELVNKVEQEFRRRLFRNGAGWAIA